MDDVPFCQLVVSGRDYATIKQYFPEYIKPLAVQGMRMHAYSILNYIILILNFCINV